MQPALHHATARDFKVAIRLLHIRRPDSAQAQQLASLIVRQCRTLPTCRSKNRTCCRQNEYLKLSHGPENSIGRLASVSEGQQTAGPPAAGLIHDSHHQRLTQLHRIASLCVIVSAWVCVQRAMKLSAEIVPAAKLGPGELTRPDHGPGCTPPRLLGTRGRSQAAAAEMPRYRTCTNTGGSRAATACRRGRAGTCSTPTFAAAARAAPA